MEAGESGLLVAQIDSLRSEAENVLNWHEDDKLRVFDKTWGRSVFV